MHPTDEMSLHQSVTPFSKNNYVKPPPQFKKQKDNNNKNKQTKNKKKYRKKPVQTKTLTFF